MRQITVTKKTAALFAISLLLLSQHAFSAAQTPAISLGVGQQDGPSEKEQLEKLADRASKLKAVVEKLPKEQAEKEDYLKRIDGVMSTLEQFESTKGQIEDLQTQIKEAEKVSIALAEQIEKFKNSKPEKQDLSKLNVLDLKTLKAKVEANMVDLRSDQGGFQEAATSYQEKKEEFDKKLSSVATELETLGQIVGKQIEPTSNEERIASLENAVRERKLTQQRTVLTLQQQLLDTNKQYDVDQMRVELVTLQLTRQDEFAKDINSRIGELRQQEADDLETKATNIAEKTTENFPQLAASEAINVKYAKDIGVLETEASKVTEGERLLKLNYESIKGKFNKTVKTIKDIRQSNTIGAMLRKRKAELPTAQSREQRASDARDRVEEIQAEKFQDSEDLTELSIKTIREEVEEANPNLTDDDLDELFRPASLKPNGDKTEPGKLVKPAEQLIERRIVLLKLRDQIYDRLFYAYVRIEADNNRVASLVGKFNGFINERILWLRSGKMLFSDLTIEKADRSLLSPDKWEELREPALMSYRKRPWLTCIGGLVLLLLLVFRPRMRKEVDALGQKAARGSCATFWPTSRAMVLTILIAVTVPLIVYGIGWVLKQATPSQSRLYDSIAVALMTAGLFAIPFEILRRTCRPDGLAVKHFNWPGNAVAKLKFHLGWYVLPVSAIVFVVSLLDRIDPAHRNDLIERVLFIIGILLTAILFFRVLSPSNGIFSQYFKRNENSWVNQTKSIWITAIVLIPIALLVLAFTGYYYTALNLTYCLVLTFAFAVALETSRGLIRRLVTVRQRAAFIESAKRKRQVEIEAAKEARKQAAAERQRRIEAGEELDESDAPVVPPEAFAELQFDFSEIKVNADHANQLIRLLGLAAWFFGLWMVWGDVLPAMKVLDEYKLWGTETETIATAESSDPSAMTAMTGMPAPDPEPKKESVAKPVPEKTESSTADSSQATSSTPLISIDPIDKPGVSVRDLLVAIALVVLTFVAARNLPNAFEMLFLEDLPFDRSARSASKALFSYGIVIFGAAFAMRTLSINWTNVQWLVTALTFGLAFGLQEIFANFVAGIILMFERPMRLGDLITVDDFTGFVTRIRTRATTVVNWDRKEYVIPNKDFITGRLINWTLSDAINRIELTVGVAYGSDVAKAKKILFDICKGHPSIVDEPPTQITFEEFGDSTLNLVVRTYLNEVTSRLPVIDSLHMQINDKFNEAEIEIAFPQQDVHFRSMDEDLAKALSSIKKDQRD